MQTWEAWPFAVATHPDAGYHNILVPPLLAEARLARDLLFVLREIFEREDKETAPGVAYSIEVDSPHTRFSVVFRINYALSESGSDLTDHASRRVPLVQGVAFLEPVPVPVAANALHLAKVVSTGAFRAFWSSESTSLWPRAAESIVVSGAVPAPVPHGYVTEIRHLRPVRLEEAEPARLVADRAQAEAAGVWRGWLAASAETGSGSILDRWLCSSVYLDVAFARYVVKRFLDTDLPLAEPPSGINFVTLCQHAHTSIVRSVKRLRRTVLIALLTIAVGAVVAAAAASDEFSPTGAAALMPAVVVACVGLVFLHNPLARYAGLRRARGVLDPAHALTPTINPLSVKATNRLAGATVANVIAGGDDDLSGLFGVHLGSWQLDVEVPTTLTATDLYRDLALTLMREGQGSVRSLLFVAAGQQRSPVASSDELHLGLESAQTRLCSQVRAFDGELLASILFRSTVNHGRLTVDCRVHLQLPTRAELCGAAAIPTSPWAIIELALRSPNRTKPAAALPLPGAHVAAGGSLRTAIGGPGRANQFSYDDLQRQLVELQRTALRAIHSSVMTPNADASPSDYTEPDVVDISIADRIACIPGNAPPWLGLSVTTAGSDPIAAAEPSAQTS